LPEFLPLLHFDYCCFENFVVVDCSGYFGYRFDDGFYFCYYFGFDSDSVEAVFFVGFVASAETQQAKPYFQLAFLLLLVLLFTSFH
jgi:hypothetical protein